MPLFEFHCPNCNNRFAQLIGMTSDSPAPVCRRCGCKDVKKLVSRFASIRSDDRKLDDLENTTLSTDPDDKKSLNRWMGEMSKEMGEEFGEDFQEYLESEAADTIDSNPDQSF